MKIKIVCKSCGGTGLYQGMGEKDGAFVVCFQCKGTGGVDFEYEPFISRQVREGCNRVYRSGAGFGITDHNINVDGKGEMPFGEYGCSYSDWLNGTEPKRLEFLACPMQEDQSACHEIDGFIAKCGEINGKYINNINSCANQCNKAECWKRFNSQQKAT